MIIEHSAINDQTGWTTGNVGHLTGEVIVRLNPDAFNNEEAMATLRASLGAELVSTTQKFGFQLWSFDGISTSAAIEELHASGVAEYAEYVQPNYVLQAANFQAEAVIPNDPQFPTLWGLNNTGQSGGTVDADIDAPEAWDVSTGAGVVVGVIDSGVDYNHPDLINQMWINTGEIAGNGIDDDNNGFVDDYYGYDFANNDGDPWDDDGHGTHVAGTIAAQADNGIGVTGVAYNAEIMALKFLDSTGSGSTFNAIRAVEYATLMGANVTNNSWGGGGFSQALEDAIFQAGQAGQVFVAAAGNGGADQIGDDNDANPHYPSNYTLSNLISVAATDRHDNLTSFSNFGATSVDLAAPGSGIWSTTPGNTYSSFSGTSMATPHVTGAVALLMASEPGLTPDEVRARILDSVDPISALDGITVTGGRLNAANALQPPQPGSISGVVWNDSNNNGAEDSGEPGLAGVTVFVDTNLNGGPDSGELTTVTNSNGGYTFSNVGPGTYQIAQVVPAGFTQTAPLFTGSYIWSDSNSAGGPTYNWFDISSVGTLLTLTDDSFVDVALPFAFDFYGQSETSVKIGSNGYLTFGADGTDYSNDAIPSASAPDAIIAPFWDDLNPVRGGDVFYYNDVANNRFIVEYDSVQPYTDTGNYTFQAILNADGGIDFQYQTMTGVLNSATIGIENHAGDDGVQVAFNNGGYLQNNLAVHFAAGSGTPTFNKVVLGSGQNLTGVDFGDHNPSGGGGGGGGGTADNFVGTGADNVFDGGGGDDAFLLRFGNDTATGGTGADEFKVDGRYLNDGDAHRITDLNFGEGDTLTLRLFDPGAFSNAVDLLNNLTVSQSGRTAVFDSIEDIVEAHHNSVMQASDAGDGSTLLTMPSGAEQMTVQLDNILFSTLGLGGAVVDPSPGNDTFVGGGGDNAMFGYGGDDGFLLRWGNDTATGGTGADRFTIDGRYVNDGDSHTITDLNFSEGDYLEFRFMDNGTFSDSVDLSNHLLVQNSGSKVRIDSVADLVEVNDHGMMTGADNGAGGTVFTTSVGGNLLTLTLDGWDIF